MDDLIALASDCVAFGDKAIVGVTAMLSAFIGAFIGALGQYTVARANAAAAEKQAYLHRQGTSFEDVGNRLADAREKYLDALAQHPGNSPGSQASPVRPVLDKQSLGEIRKMLFSARDRNSRYLPPKLRGVLKKLTQISCGPVPSYPKLVKLGEDLNTLFDEAQDALDEGCPKPGKLVE